ncbi:Rrt8p Ecym_2642 [Eremothecium cymbalariae DBVPG|uniref:Uncharacterized protein n=1 Tax=Eremothecium cymbalariae (strain CBS 270.75 / DBVPG 7215 / KCTC 17166 / NRRL Y-17582) TaxID=931890 RepID=G8JNS9_ERECY|nr:Hypothetical protein Ecym_2642 [Eremothecium cymbalariae DBVPG\
MIIGLVNPQIWIQAVALLIIYVFTFVGILAFLVVLWTPVFLPISVIFGPAGPLGYVLTLYTNTQFFTTMIVNSNLATPWLDHTLSTMLKLPLLPPSAAATQLSEPKQPDAHEILSVMRIVCGGMAMIVVVAIPIVGPIMLMLAMNVKIAYDNFERYLILHGVGQVQRRDLFYQHIIQFIYYGGSYTILSFVPLFSVWAFVCYPIGIKAWGRSNAIYGQKMRKN